MGNGGTVEEGDHSAIAILAMPRESTDELELSQPILRSRNYPCRRKERKWQLVQSKVQKRLFPKTDLGVRLSVRHLRHRRVYCRITVRPR